MRPLSAPAFASRTAPREGSPLTAARRKKSDFATPPAELAVLRQLDAFHVPHRPEPSREPATASGLLLLEAELLDRGHAPDAPLRRALGSLAPAELAAAGTRLLALVDHRLGADRTHIPLFRRFPHKVPRDADRLYVDRVFALLLQAPDQPCVLCSHTRTVHPVSPCAHLVCRACWDGSAYAGCPLCNRRIDLTDPFLRPAPATSARRAAAKAGRAPQGPLRILRLGAGPAADALAVVGRLLARRTPLSPQDREDLAVLLPLAPAGLAWLHTEIPVRETKALVLGHLLADPRTAGPVLPRLREQLTTATDVLRLLAVRSGGPADLSDPPRFRSLPRPLRRELLAVLDALPLPLLVEDLGRHARAWLRAAETLHPYEQHARHPRAALAFAVLRRTDVGAAGPLGEALRQTAAAHPGTVRTSPDGTRLTAVTFGTAVEEALAAGDSGAALALLRARPGELVRRLDHLLRLHPAGPLDPELARALAEGLPRVGAGPLLSCLGALRTRDRDRRGPAGPRRVFFPRGRVAHAYSLPEQRAPLPAALVAEVCGLLTAEVLRRLGGRDPYETAVLDSGLADLTVPFAERAAAASLVAVPRGSSLPLPGGGVLRLFLHWMEPPEQRTDLDLSVALYDADWQFAGLCDYTRLVFRDRAAVHSGDLTSAPAPTGATEYVDLDLAALAGLGAAYAVPVVLGYNNVPFEDLPDAFAGFMRLPEGGARDASYDPRTVRQRFDLAGASTACVPMVVDLARRTAVWTDVHLPPAEGFQSIRSQRGNLGRIARELTGHFGSGARTTLWDLAVWQAAARAPEAVVVRRAPRPGTVDELWTYRRRAQETAGAFADRLAALDAPEERRPADDADRAAAQAAAGRRAFLALVHGDVCPEGATGTAYRLFPGRAEPGPGFDRATAGDLVADLG